MELHVESRHLGGDVWVLVPEYFQDARGFFAESWRADHFRSLGLPTEFPQDNHSGSVKGVVRGLHFQWDRPMAKLMRVTRGAAFVVAVDIRKGSPTLGQWVGIEASEQNHRQVFAPAGFARGFCVLSDWAEVQYKCTAVWNPKAESGLRWNDPQIGIEWPVEGHAALLSNKDARAQTLAEWLARPEADAFTYRS